MADIRPVELNDIEDMPEILRGILKKHNIDVWKNGTMGRVYFVPLCHIIDILVQYEETDNISRAAAIEAINNVEINFSIASRHNLAGMRKEIQMIIDELLKAQTKAINKLPKQL